MSYCFINNIIDNINYFMHNRFIRVKETTSREPACDSKPGVTAENKYALAGCRLDYLTGKYERGTTNESDNQNKERGRNAGQ